MALPYPHSSYIIVSPSAKELSEIHLFEKIVYFVLTDSTIGDQPIMIVVIVEFAPEFVTLFAWIYPYFTWPSHFVSHIIEYRHQLGGISL